MSLLPRLILLAIVFATPQLLAAQPDLSGIWMLQGLAKEDELQLTEKGRAIQAEYDILVDDPSLKCEPASLSRVWANPNVSIAVEQAEDHVLISYEFFDLRRMIPLGDERVMPEGPSTRNVAGDYFAKMGSSFGRYDDDRLVIETRNHEAGYIRTSAGVPQSENTVSIEELWLENGVLMMQQTHVDETLFEKPFVVNYRFERIDAIEIPLYECTDADYGWFEQLNQSSKDEE